MNADRIYRLMAWLYLLYVLMSLIVWFTGIRLWIQPVDLFLQSTVLLFGILAFKLPFSFKSNFLKTTAQTLKVRKAILLMFLGTSTFLLLTLVNRYVFFQFMNSADEHSCHFLAQCLLHGRLWSEPPAFADFFQTPHIGNLQGKWFSVFPPGWPLVWALGMKFGLTHWTNPLLAAFGVTIFFYLGSSIYGTPKALLGVLFLTLSPLFFLNASGYFSHSLCLLLMALFLVGLLQWLSGGNGFWPFLAGFSLGYGFATRYLTVAAFSVPFLFYLGMQYKKGNSSIRKYGGHFFLPFVILIVMHLIYNFLITGNPVNPPNHYLHPHERLGFIAGYSPWTAIVYLFQRFFYLSSFSVAMIPAFFLLNLFRRPKNDLDGLLKISACLIPISYMLYYSWGGNQFGPRYFFEAFPIFCFGAADFLIDCMHSKEQPLQRMGIALTISSVILSLPTTAKHLEMTYEFTKERKSGYELVNTKAKKPALVFIRGFLGNRLVMPEEDAIRNDPFFQSDVIYATDRGAENEKLVSYFKDRHFYLLSYNRKENLPVLEPL